MHFYFLFSIYVQLGVFLFFFKCFNFYVITKMHIKLVDGNIANDRKNCYKLITSGLDSIHC